MSSVSRQVGDLGGSPMFIPPTSRCTVRGKLAFSARTFTRHLIPAIVLTVSNGYGGILLVYWQVLQLGSLVSQSIGCRYETHARKLRKLRFKAPCLNAWRARPKGMMMSEETLGIADIPEILRLLPHRCPFLLIDRVLFCSPGSAFVR